MLVWLIKSLDPLSSAVCIFAKLTITSQTPTGSQLFLLLRNRPSSPYYTVFHYLLLLSCFLCSLAHCCTGLNSDFMPLGGNYYTALDIDP